MAGDGIPGIFVMRLLVILAFVGAGSLLGSPAPLSHYTFDGTMADATGQNPDFPLELWELRRDRFGDDNQAVDVDYEVALPGEQTYDGDGVASLAFWMLDVGRSGGTMPAVQLGPIQLDVGSNGGFLLMRTGSGGTTSSPELIELPRNAWIHMALTTDGATIWVYVNGQLSITYALPESVTLDPAYPEIVFTDFGVVDDFDEIRLYEAVLSGEQVAAIYDAGRMRDPGLTLTIRQAVAVEFASEAGRRYLVQAATELDGSWTDFVEVEGTGEVVTVYDFVDAPRQFYRVFETVQPQ